MAPSNRALPEVLGPSSENDLVNAELDTFDYEDEITIVRVVEKISFKPQNRLINSKSNLKQSAILFRRNTNVD